MDKKDIENIMKICEDTSLFELMKNHTTFRIGGPSDIFSRPKDELELSKLIKYARDNSIDYLILGNGSNMLITDKGFRGLVINFSNNFSNIEIKGNRVYCQSGSLLSKVSKETFKESLTGMEKISGIPASIGGAITMNAGAYGREIKDIVESVRCMDRDGNIREYSNEEMHFSYRHSRVKEEDLVVLSCVFKLEKGDKEEILEEFREYTKKRLEKQPLDKPSAGSTFKRPEKGFASKMIDEAGLRGLSVNDAQVSEKHTGFIINRGNASSRDVLELIDLVEKRVYEKFKVKLEPELIIKGEK